MGQKIKKITIDDYIWHCSLCNCVEEDAEISVLLQRQCHWKKMNTEDNKGKVCKCQWQHFKTMYHDKELLENEICTILMDTFVTDIQSRFSFAYI